MGQINPESFVKVYNSMKEIGYEMPPFIDWLKGIALFHQTENGGIALSKDLKDENIWWVQVHCPGELPEREVLRGLMVLCQKMGCHYLASATKSPLTSRLLSMLGFQRLEENFFGLKLIDTIH